MQAAPGLFKEEAGVVLRAQRLVLSEDLRFTGFRDSLLHSASPSAEIPESLRGTLPKFSW